MPLRLRNGAEALSELEREQDVRSRCYRRWVKDGKMSMVDATDRFERMASAIYIVRALMTNVPQALEHPPEACDSPLKVADKPDDKSFDDVPF